MKSLIITLTGNYNYGNRLQNYALQEVLKRKELEVETYNNIYMNPKTQEIKIKNAKMDLKRIIRGIKSRILKKDKYKVQDKKRSVKIKDFNDKYIIMSDKKKEELNGAYDYFILGSDQVWNPNFVNDLDINLDSCLNGNIISYAASFGVDKIYNNVYDLYKTSLMKMDYISVREKNGKILAEQLSNKNVKIVLDPTMLLTVQEWENLEEKPEIYDEKKYLLIYCVSKEHNKLRKYVNKIAKEKHLNIIDLSDKDSKEYISGVEEFLFYIHHAEMIFTDSFHACVFSIILAIVKVLPDPVTPNNV